MNSGMCNEGRSGAGSWLNELPHSHFVLTFMQQMLIILPNEICAQRYSRTIPVALGIRSPTVPRIVVDPIVVCFDVAAVQIV